MAILNNYRYVIYAPTFDENDGGAIALHRLCDLLNRYGMQSCIYPVKPHFRGMIPFRLLDNLAVTVMERILARRFRTFDEFDTPLCLDFDPDNDVIVYPEIIIGNPLGARHIVRWLLHKPGHFVDEFTFEEDDLFFYYQKAFLEGGNITNIGGELRIVYLHEAYKNESNPDREGTCYILRKGKGRDIIHDLDNSVLIDGLSHTEIAKIFNSSKTFVSYDMYTMYSRYAAACGCLSVVVPELEMDKYSWRPEEMLRWGIAYGFDDVEWAITTQNKVLPALIDEEKYANQTSIVNFIKKCETHFFHQHTNE